MHNRTNNEISSTKRVYDDINAEVGESNFESIQFDMAIDIVSA